MFFFESELAISFQLFHDIKSQLLGTLLTDRGDAVDGALPVKCADDLVFFAEQFILVEQVNFIQYQPARFLCQLVTEAIEFADDSLRRFDRVAAIERRYVDDVQQ